MNSSELEVESWIPFVQSVRMLYHIDMSRPLAWTYRVIVSETYQRYEGARLQLNGLFNPIIFMPYISERLLIAGREGPAMPCAMHGRWRHYCRGHAFSETTSWERTFLGQTCLWYSNRPTTLYTWGTWIHFTTEQIRHVMIFTRFMHIVFQNKAPNTCWKLPTIAFLDKQVRSISG